MNWVEKFKLVFNTVGDNLASLLDAGGCRERWLQGEFFRILRTQDPAFRTDHYSLGRNSKADFYGEQPCRMIAELKVLGNGYMTKCIDGNNRIECYMPAHDGQRIRIGKDHRTRTCGYLLHDYVRLFDLTDVCEKYVILVMDLRGKLDRMGIALQAIQLSEEEWTITRPDHAFTVRIWKI